MGKRWGHLKMTGVVLGVTCVSLFSALFILRVTFPIILDPALTDAIDRRILNAVPDPSRCTLDLASPFPTSNLRIIYRDFPLIPQARDANQRRPVLMFGSSFSRNIATTSELRDRNIFNLSMPLATPSVYEAILNYLEEKYEVLGDGYTGGAVVIFASSLSFSITSKAINQSAFIFPQFGVYRWAKDPSGKFVISENSDIFGISTTRLAALGWHFFLTRDLPTLLDLNRNVTMPVASEEDPERLAVCREEATMREHYDDLDAYIREYFAEFEMPGLDTAALERIAVMLQEHHMPLIIVHFPVIDDIYNSSYQREYMNYMSEFAKKYDVTVYDWSNLLDDRYFRDWAHPTEEGRNVVTEAFFQMLDEKGL